jgi:hypothetical protein
MLAERAFGQLASVWSKMRVLSRWVAVNQSGGQSGPMSDPQPWHFTTLLDALDHWQTLFAGVLAVLAAWRTIRATTKSADREVKASQDQTAVAQKQIETTIQLAQKHDEDEYDAFRLMLEAAMTRVLFEAEWAKKAYPEPFAPTTEKVSVEAYTVRQCITKGAFAELRSACVKMRSPLTGEFLYLEGEIDRFAAQWAYQAFSGAVTSMVRKGKLAGLGDQLAVIEAKAVELREKAAQDRYGIVWPGRAEQDGLAG